MALTRVPTPGGPGPATWRTYFGPTALPFWAVHVLAIAGVVWLGLSWTGLLVAGISYFIRMFFVTGAYHRYFSHRTFKTSRAFQFFLALGAQTSAQKGVMWWSSHHRWHHKYSDEPPDVHSAKLRGFWYSHVGWFLGPDWSRTDESRVSDLARFPELRLLNRPSLQLMPALASLVILWLIGGAWLALWGGFVATVLLWHGTFTINSLSHMFGSRKYATSDDSRNNWLLALITMGEGWHNNHHHYAASARQGFFWWEIDATYYVLKALSWIGLVRDLREPPARVLVERGEGADEPAPALDAPAEPPSQLPA